MRMIRHTGKLIFSTLTNDTSCKCKYYLRVPSINPTIVLVVSRPSPLLLSAIAVARFAKFSSLPGETNISNARRDGMVSKCGCGLVSLAGDVLRMRRRKTEELIPLFSKARQKCEGGGKVLTDVDELIIYI